MKNYDGWDVSIIIATLLRPSLGEVLSSIRSDLPKAQIIVITHRTPTTEESNILLNYRITLVVNPTNSIGKSWNLGLQAVKNQYFTFFSDDDVWVPQSISKHRDQLLFSKIDFVLGSVIVESRNKVNKMKPRECIRDSFYELLNGSNYRHGRKYVSLTSFLARSEMVKIKFREDISFWEDILWLITLEKNGYKYNQDNTVRARILINYKRASERENVESYFTIARELENLKTGQGKKFLKQVAIRNNLAAGRWGKIYKLIMFGKQDEAPVKLSTWDLMLMSNYLVLAFLRGAVITWRS